MISLLLPFATSLPVILALLALAGLTAGTFYPLTLSFVLRNLPMRYVLLGIAMYAMDIVFTTNFATALEAWFMGHLSWRWIFWNSTALTPVMMVLVYFGIPWQPLPTPKPGTAQAELERLFICQPGIRAAVHRARSGPEAGLAEFRHNRRTDRHRIVLAG